MTSMLEIQRVADHIQRAEVMATNRDTSKLSYVQQLVRKLLLQALTDYRADGRFPKNRDFAKRTPYFIDADGTRCAMAHLMELGGERDLVAKIAAERNNAYVRELADEPALLAWLEAAGLSVEEAAAIQPSYCELITNCICGGDFSFIEYPVPARGVIEGVVQTNGKLRVDRTYGDVLGMQIGSEVTIATEAAVGSLVVAPIDSASGPIHGVILDQQNEYACHSQGVGAAPKLSASEFARAVTSNDCAGELRAQSSDWNGDSCEETIEPGTNDGGGCTTSAGAEVASVGILLALVTALARRR
jgi:hypothetical protein